MIKKIKPIFVFLSFVLFVNVNAIHAQDGMVYPTLPGTSFRDYSKPGYKIDIK